METLAAQILETSDEAMRLNLAAKAVGLEDHRRMLRDAARRVQESHEAMAKAAGFEVSQPEEEEMGDINISGDHYFNTAPAKQEQTPSSPTPSTPPADQGDGGPTPSTETGSGLLGPVAAAVATGAIGLAIGLASSLWSGDRPQVDPDAYALRLLPPETPEAEERPDN